MQAYDNSQQAQAPKANGKTLGDFKQDTGENETVVKIKHWFTLIATFPFRVIAAFFKPPLSSIPLYAISIYCFLLVVENYYTAIPGNRVALFIPKPGLEDGEFGLLMQYFNDATFWICLTIAVVFQSMQVLTVKGFFARNQVASTDQAINRTATNGWVSWVARIGWLIDLITAVFALSGSVFAAASNLVEFGLFGLFTNWDGIVALLAFLVKALIAGLYVILSVIGFEVCWAMGDFSRGIYTEKHTRAALSTRTTVYGRN